MKFKKYYFEKASSDFIKNILNSDEVYKILDNNDKTYGLTPCAGGCAVIAFALSKYYNYPVYVLYNNDKDVVDHFVIKTNENTYIDCEGEHDDIIKSFKIRENINDDIVLLPYDKKINIGDIIINDDVINKLFKHFKNVIKK